MLNTQELISEAVSLPVNMRAMLANKLLESLNHSDAKVDESWAKLAEERIDQLKEGHTSTIPGDEVFKKIKRIMK